MGSHRPLDFMVLTPAGACDPSLAIAASRANALGILNLDNCTNLDQARSSLNRLRSFGRRRIGVQLSDLSERTSSWLTELLLPAAGDPFVVVLSQPSGDGLGRQINTIHDSGALAYIVVTDVEQGKQALEFGADALIAKGNEAAGWVGEESSFVLLQHLLPLALNRQTPLWVQGGVGPHSVAACLVAGASGVVLDSQVLLARESPLPAGIRDRIASMDGSETVCLGTSLGAQFRAYSRPHLRPLESLIQLEQQLAQAPAADNRKVWRDRVDALVDWQDVDGHLLALGQDGCFAAGLARQFGTVAGIIDGLGKSALAHCAIAQTTPALAPGAPLAAAHGTAFPLVQGPMTRVSDRAAFASDVADGGALPLIALALMREPEVETLLAETAQLLGERPWGVGILGFVPPELRAEQLGVIRKFRPPFALIAGGRPDQARALEQDGIVTYLHVPSPTLLRMYMQDGARRFVFEGRECGGHVGPRTSFVLWDSMVDELLANLPPGADLGSYHVLFAGGIHDDLSGAMTAAIAAPLVERGVRVGALMGTAYLFTEEVVRSGAITAAFQQAAVDCDETVLLLSGPGQATRCLPSPFVDIFESEKRRLQAAGLPAEELRNELEVLNIGRLRIASKGLDRNPDYNQSHSPDVPKLMSLAEDEQWQRGMYMIGQVAGLREQVGTIRELHERVSAGSTELLTGLALTESGQEPEPLPPADIAIVGIGCILPGAADLATFWSNILNKVDSVGEVPESRWDWRNYYDADRSARDKIYSRWGGFIDDVPFDPLAFGMPPASLASIEPFQLLGLLVVQAALKDAGLLDRPFPRERTSVILGAGGGGADLSGNYVVRSSLPELIGEQSAPLIDGLGPVLPEWTEDSFPGILMNVAAGRIANRFDLGGTNFTVDAACASSLAAIYLAARDLQSGASDVAIAGGVDAIQNPFAFLCFSKTQALSPNGRCRPFDANADGIAISEGYATVVLKRLADAERDGDRIYAVIRGVGSASDGRDRSLTAPRPEGQVRALRRAYQQAGFSPATVGLIEAHGTGTVAGDRAEIESLTTFFGQAGAGLQQCAVGSVKSMIGHTKAAAGVAGLIKAALALHTRVLPPTLGVTEPNPKANFPASPFYVNTETRPWSGGIDGNPRRAGVSAFGFGGTNFHVVLEEYTGDYLPVQRLEPEERPAEILTWRGDSRQAISGQLAKLAEAIEAGARPRLADLSYSLVMQASRNAGDPALAIVAESIDDLVEKLRTARAMLEGSAEREHNPSGIHFAEQPMLAEGKVAFLFPGQGSQTVNMGRDVAVAFTEALSTFEHGDQVLSGSFERQLSRYIFPPPVFTPEASKQLRAELTETNIAQPALGVTELAYLKVLRAFGVRPDMAAGHSYGEFVALCAAGCIDDATLLRLSEARGRFMREGATGESGTMAAIMAGPEALRPLLDDPELTLANLNAPLQTVVSGSQASIERAIAWSQEHGLRAQQLPVACAFHSPFVAPAQQRLVALLRETSFSAPSFPVYSNTTAESYPAERDAIVELLGNHLVRPVDWTNEIEAMYRDGARIFVEVGPRTVLSNLVDQILPDRPHLCLPVEQGGKPGVEPLLNALAALLVEGAEVRLERLFAGHDLTRLDLDNLPVDSGEPEYSPTTWLINGGKARPAASQSAVPSAKPKVQVTALEEWSETASSDISNYQLQSPVVATFGLDAPEESVQQPENMYRNGNGVHPMTMTTPRPAPSANGYVRENSRRGGEAGHDEYQFDTPAEPRPRYTAEAESRLDDTEVDTVIDRFQDVMRHFLDVQRDVMVAYLQGGQEARNRAAAYRPAPPRRLAATPAQAVTSVRPTPTLPAELSVRPTIEPSEPAPRLEDVRNPNNGNSAHDVHEQVTSRPPDVVDVAETPVAPAVSLAPDREMITGKLLSVVSERTGYPTEMLDLDADLEADLGIDSIKRVEIVGMITQSLPMPAGMTVDTEQLTTSRTLRQVIDMLLSLFGPAEARPTETAEARLPFDQVPSDSRVGRYVLRAARLSPASSLGRLAPGGVIVIVDDHMGAGTELECLLTNQGYRVSRVVVGRADGQNDTLMIDPARPDLAALIQAVHQRGTVCALIYLPALRADNPNDGQDMGSHNLLFQLSQALLPDLEASAPGGAAIVGATMLGGTFAIDAAPSRINPLDGAIHGFLKSAAQEWPAIRVKALDFAPAPTTELAQHLLEELLAADEAVEVCYQGAQRLTLELQAAPLMEQQLHQALGRDSVVLATGGARGITAEALLLLARAYQPTLLLIGRTPLPEGPEEAPTASLTEPAALKRAIIDQLSQTGEKVAPAAVEARYQRLLREREVRENLSRLREAGARVDYFACDVRDAAAFGALIDLLYDTYGRIDGVIHGAGIIEDKLIRDKSLASFERVIGTKIDGAMILGQKLRPETLQFLVFFSSISGRLGNRGQGDYAAANEILNKLAQQLDRSWPSHVVSINWGPWLKTGMASPEVRRQFAERGVELVTIEAGCRALRDELLFGRKGDVEIVIGGQNAMANTAVDLKTPLPELGEGVGSEGVTRAPLTSRLPMLAVNSSATGRPDGAAGVERLFDPNVDIYLQQHRIDGHPVLPFAAAIELLAEAATQMATSREHGLEVSALRDIQLLRGVVFDGEPLKLQVTAVTGHSPGRDEPQPSDSLALEITSTANPTISHYRATVGLTRPELLAAAAEEFPLDPLADPGPFPLSVEEAYRTLLFHGPLLQGIVSIGQFSPEGARASLRPSLPAGCLRGAEGTNWLFDPVLIDSALQLQVLWARLNWGITLLPTTAECIRRFQSLDDGAGPRTIPLVRHEMRIRPGSRSPLCQADHAFYAPDGRLLYQIAGIVGVGSERLNRLGGTR